jgi:hypothetical protein
MLRVGAVCQINGCREIPGVDGAVGQIMDMQFQEIDYSRAYPLWVEILSGNHRGKTYGFNYNEVEVVTPRITLPRELVAA